MQLRNTFLVLGLSFWTSSTPDRARNFTRSEEHRTGPHLTDNIQYSHYAIHPHVLVHVLGQVPSSPFLTLSLPLAIHTQPIIDPDGNLYAKRPPHSSLIRFGQEKSAPDAFSTRNVSACAGRTMLAAMSGLVAPHALNALPLVAASDMLTSRYTMRALIRFVRVPFRWPADSSFYFCRRQNGVRRARHWDWVALAVAGHTLFADEYDARRR